MALDKGGVDEVVAEEPKGAGNSEDHARSHFGVGIGVKNSPLKPRSRALFFNSVPQFHDSRVSAAIVLRSSGSACTGICVPGVKSPCFMGLSSKMPWSFAPA